MAIIWPVIGWRAIVGAEVDVPSAMHLLIPGAIRGALWILSGLFAAAIAMNQQRNGWGLAVLFFMPFTLTMSYLLSWLQELIPGEPPGDPNGWAKAAFTTVLVGLVVLLSHIPAQLMPPRVVQPKAARDAA